VLTLLKGLPASYQRDLQEDKPPLFDAVRTLEASLAVLTGLVGTLQVDRARLAAAAGRGQTTATAVADTLVGLGVPFRAAHHITGELVAATEAAGSDLAELTDEAITAALAGSDDARARKLASTAGVAGDLRAAATVEGAIARCDVVGGTAPVRVRAELDAARRRVGGG
jgi:argininosuccinate lyase